MSGLDYYGRLMRRATARAEIRPGSIADPFDVTAPWPLAEPHAGHAATTASGAGQPGPAVAPALPAAPATSPIVTPPPALQLPDVARAHVDAARRPLDPASAAAREEQLNQPSAMQTPQRIATPLHPTEQPIALVAMAPRGEGPGWHMPLDPPRVSTGSSIEARVVEGETDAAAPGVVPVAAIGEAAARTVPPAMLRPAAPPLRVPIVMPPEGAVQTPVISIGEIDIEVDSRAPMAAAPSPAATAHAAAQQGRHAGRVDPDLLRGPTHRAFGIGQV